MRQKDKEFAELLNRLRLRKKDEPMLQDDIAMLKNVKRVMVMTVQTFTFMQPTVKLMCTTYICCINYVLTQLL